MLNNVILQGRLIRDPEVQTKRKGEEEIITARYTLMVGRDRKVKGQPEADFIRCFVAGTRAAWAAKYLVKGTGIIVEGRWQSSSYETGEGQKLYMSEVFVRAQYFWGANRISQELEPSKALSPEQHPTEMLQEQDFNYDLSDFEI